MATGRKSEGDRALLRALWMRSYLPNLLFATGQGAIVPVLAIAAKHLGASSSLAALIVALNGLGTMLTDLPAGWIIAKLGERRSTLVATLLMLVGLSGCFFARSVAPLAVGIFVQASGWAIWSLVRLTNISRISSVTTRGRALSIFGGVSRAGQVVGPFLVAGLASSRSVTVSFVIYFLCASAGYLWLEVARDRSDLAALFASPAGPRSHEVIITHRREFATAGVTSYVLGILRASRQVLLPLWGAHIGLDITQISLVYGLSSIIDVSLFYPSGSISDRYGRRAVAIPCMGFLAVGHLLLPLAHSETSLLLVALLLGFGNGLGAGIVMTLGADRAPEVGRPAFLALWRLVSDAGASSGPMLDSVLIGAISLAVAGPLVGVLGVAATLFTARYLEETHVVPERARAIADAESPPTSEWSTPE